MMDRAGAGPRRTAPKVRVFLDFTVSPLVDGWSDEDRMLALGA